MLESWRIARSRGASPNGTLLTPIGRRALYVIQHSDSRSSQPAADCQRQWEACRAPLLLCEGEYLVLRARLLERRAMIGRQDFPHYRVSAR